MNCLRDAIHGVCVSSGYRSSIATHNYRREGSTNTARAGIFLRGTGYRKRGANNYCAPNVKVDENV